MHLSSQEDEHASAGFILKENETAGLETPDLPGADDTAQVFFGQIAEVFHFTEKAG